MLTSNHVVNDQITAIRGDAIVLSRWKIAARARQTEPPHAP